MAEQHHNEAETRREQTARVFTIAPATPFLPALARFVLDWRSADGRRLADDPATLADSTVFLPTRRAARAFGVALQAEAAQLTGAPVVALPRIATLGDSDEAEALSALVGDFSDLEILAAGMAPIDAWPIDPQERRLVLARLIRGWVEAINPQTRALLKQEAIVLPSSAADSIWLADDLARLIDQIETEEADWQAIRAIVPEDQHLWWQLTLAFLAIVLEHWPAYLAERGLTGPARHRAELARRRIGQVTAAPPRGLVLAAGTTGSIPATSRLLAAIAGLPNGAVVLPGLDRDLPQAVAAMLQAREDSEAVAGTHPQFGLYRLLEALDCPRGEVRQLEKVPAEFATRQGVIEAAMLPAQAVADWPELRARYEDGAVRRAFAGISIVEAANERQEAMAIAVALREVLADPAASAALVTPDRNLARRVSAELERFAIGIDDSAGRPVSDTPAARLARNLLGAAGPQGSALSLAALLKDRLLFGGGAHHLADLLELAILRDAIVVPPADDLAAALRAAQARAEAAPHLAIQLKRLDAAQWDRLADFAGRLSAAIAPLAGLCRSAAELDSRQLCAALSAALTALLSPPPEGEAPPGNAPALAGFEGGPELSAFFDRMRLADPFAFPPQQAVAVFDALIAPLRVRRAERTHPRLHLYGPLEARLQHHDTIVLAGLNEGVWPAIADNDPFLNRTMRAQLGLPLPERRIGLAAHDFCQLSGAPKVIYSRSQRLASGPAVASRWLQRLVTFLGEDAAVLQERGRRLLGLAGALDAGDTRPVALQRTQFAPPLAARPKAFSITEIETLIRDPYAIHARHVLQLDALPPLLREAGARERGTLYHAILADFVALWPQPPEAGGRERALDTLMEIAARRFAEAGLPPETESAWLQRFGAIAEPFVDWEIGRRDGIAESHCEVGLPRTQIADTGVTLRGRADRIDRRIDGTLEVIDYKTGGRPSNKEARTIAPQLALEGAFARRGAFDGVAGGAIADLLHVRLRESNRFKPESVTGGQKKEEALSADDLAEKALENLAGLLRDYQRPEKAYVSQWAPDAGKRFAGDYDHLARVKEWSIGGGEDGGDDGSGGEGA